MQCFFWSIYILFYQHSFIFFYLLDGFKKLVSTDHGGIKSDNPEWEFHHPYFAREKSELLELVKRKVCELIIGLRLANHPVLML